MGTTTEGVAVEREILIAASPEAVWSFLVDPQKAVRWMGLVADIDCRPGGAYRVEVLPGRIARGEFVVVEPPTRLIYTWGWEPGSGSHVPPASTTVQFLLVPEGHGTRVTLTHRGLPDASSAAGHSRGWIHYLSRLEVVARGDDPGADPWLERPPA